jgi:putative flippase GtrA
MSLSFWALTSVVGINYLVSNIALVLPGTAMWFVGNALWTFKDRKTTHNSFINTIPTRVATFAGREGLMALFTSVFGLYYLASAFVATLLVFGATYWLADHWIWGKGIPQATEQPKTILTKAAGVKAAWVS